MTEIERITKGASHRRRSGQGRGRRLPPPRARHDAARAAPQDARRRTITGRNGRHSNRLGRRHASPQHQAGVLQERAARLRRPAESGDLRGDSGASQTAKADWSTGHSASTSKSTPTGTRTAPRTQSAGSSPMASSGATRSRGSSTFRSSPSSGTRTRTSTRRAATRPRMARTPPGARNRPERWVHRMARILVLVQCKHQSSTRAAWCKHQSSTRVLRLIPSY